MVIYSSLSGSKQLVESWVNFQRHYSELPAELSFYVKIKGTLQICCRGKWHKYEPFEKPLIDLIKSVHGAEFLQVTFDDIDLASGEVLESGVINYYPFYMIDKIVVE